MPQESLPGMKLKGTVLIRRIMAISMLYGIPGLPNLFAEREEKFLKRIINRGQVAIDIGANVGVYTLYLSKLVGKEGHVYAFEPFKPTYKLLSKTIKYNKLKNVSCYNNALGEKETQISLEVPKLNNGRIDDQFAHIKSASGGEINMVRLDRFIQENGISNVSFIKVDVEGYEYFVFEGARETIERFRPVILTEIDTRWTRRYNTSPQAVENLLSSFGYKEYVLDKTNLIRSSVSSSKYYNFFFLPYTDQ